LTAAREEILGKIRSALKSGESSGRGVAASAHVSSDDAKAGDTRRRCEDERIELLERFESELTRIGVRTHHAATIDSAAEYVEHIASKREARIIIGSCAEVVESLGLDVRLGTHGIRYVTEAGEANFRSIASEADIGVSGIDYALADTGTLVLLTGEGQARSISLLPPVHIAVVNPDQIVSGLDDLFALARSERKDKQLPSAVTFITGPSRTADIELTLVIGVHGPQELHVVILESDQPGGIR
jgi:L-lactate utilization protein LutC